VTLLEEDAVGVARLEVLDEHPASDLVLLPGGIGKWILMKQLEYRSKTAGVPSSCSSVMSSSQLMSSPGSPP
jgi:hypothetical protein